MATQFKKTNTYDLTGKIALISGAASGMGADAAKRLLECGAKVVGMDVNETLGNALAQELGENFRFIKGDVSKKADWLAAVKLAEDTFGTLTTLVNAAGIVSSNMLENVTEEEFMRTMSIDALGGLLGMQAAVPSMRKSGGGSCIMFAAESSYLSGAGMTSYVGSKWAARGMAMVWANELGREDIRVNSISPGMVETPILNAMGGHMTVEMLQPFLDQRPMNRLGKCEEISSIVAWLASDESTFSTGADYQINGGSLTGA